MNKEREEGLENVLTQHIVMNIVSFICKNVLKCEYDEKYAGSVFKVTPSLNSNGHISFVLCYDSLELCYNLTSKLPEYNEEAILTVIGAKLGGDDLKGANYFFKVSSDCRHI